MYGRKVKLRFLFVVLILITLILTVFLVLKSLEENVVYFQSPSEIKILSEVEVAVQSIKIVNLVFPGSNVQSKAPCHNLLIIARSCAERVRSACMPVLLEAARESRCGVLKAAPGANARYRPGPRSQGDHALLWAAACTSGPHGQRPRAAANRRGRRSGAFRGLVCRPAVAQGGLGPAKAVPFLRENC